MFKKTNQEENTSSSKTQTSNGGNLLIAAAIFLAGITIAAAVLFKDKVTLPINKQPQEQEVAGAKTEQPTPTQPSSRIDLATPEGPTLGKEDAPVTIIEISDFSCPYCAASNGFREDVIESLTSRDPSWQAALPAIKEKYIDSGKVRLVFIAVPLHGQIALDASAASLCAQDQGKYWEYHDKLFENQNTWYSEDLGENGHKDLLKQYAKDLGFDTKKFNECFDNETYADEIMANYSLSNSVFEKLQTAELTREGQAGLGTPTYVINGRYLAGAQSYSEFEKVIEEELSNQ